MLKTKCPVCNKGEIKFSHNTQVPLELTSEGKLKPSTNLKQYNFFDSGLHICCTKCGLEEDEVSDRFLKELGLRIDTDNYVVD